MSDRPAEAELTGEKSWCAMGSLGIPFLVYYEIGHFASRTTGL
jgi:hypothetical protein